MISHAIHDIRVALDGMNERDMMCGLPPLHEQDKTWGERAGEIALRASILVDWAARGDLDTIEVALNSLGAQVLATKLAIMAARETRLP